MAFTENNVDGLIYMSSSVIRTKHAFTTRFGGVSTGDFASLNLGFGRGDAPENYRRLTALMGAEIDGCAVTRQVHGNEVRVVTRADRHECGAPVPYEADGIITTERGLPIMCFVADCVPALLCDAENGVIAAVHCGWRSSVADILGVTVEKMCALWRNTSAARRTGFSTRAPAGRRWLTCARRTRAVSSSSACGGRI